MDASSSITRTIVVNAPKSAVWAAITDPDKISRWFGQRTSLNLSVGGKATFTWDEHGTARAVITEIDEPNAFGFRWAADIDADPDVRLDLVGRRRRTDQTEFLLHRQHQVDGDLKLDFGQAAERLDHDKRADAVVEPAAGDAVASQRPPAGIHDGGVAQVDQLEHLFFRGGADVDRDVHQLSRSHLLAVSRLQQVWRTDAEDAVHGAIAHLDDDPLAGQQRTLATWAESAWNT